ncbi:hypothetical protein MHU86_22587 [Fragilaria crotonensis]|nr:hypothetical protein MHU86_22587 [Fragilaria crotonensis]
MFDSPRALFTTASQPIRRIVSAAATANLPMFVSAADISSAVRFATARRGESSASTEACAQGGARRSQDESASAVSPWPPRQALAEPPPPASATIARNSGLSMPVWSSATFTLTACKESWTWTCIARKAWNTSAMVGWCATC